nr:MAG TPA: hypothetical protein [Caudoviricetes sp.]
MFPWSGPGLTTTSMYGMILFSALFSKRGFSRPTNEVPPVSGWGHLFIVRWLQWCF